MAPPLQGYYPLFTIMDKEIDPYSFAYETQQPTTLLNGNIYPHALILNPREGRRIVRASYKIEAYYTWFKAVFGLATSSDGGRKLPSPRVVYRILVSMTNKEKDRTPLRWEHGNEWLGVGRMSSPVTQQFRIERQNYLTIEAWLPHEYDKNFGGQHTDECADGVVAQPTLSTHMPI